METPAKPVVLAKGEQTRQLILDAAEQLFAEGHYDSISMRDIAERANVLLGVVSYHFKKKELLFKAAVTRRAQESNSRRIAELRRFENPTVEQILEAFVKPSLEMHLNPKWRSYSRLVAMISHRDEWRSLNNDLFHETGMEFYRALQRALPDVQAEPLSRGFIYAVFVLSGSVNENSRLNDLSGGAYSPNDFEAMHKTMIPFLASGLRAMANVRLPGQAPKKSARKPTSRKMVAQTA